MAARATTGKSRALRLGLMLGCVAPFGWLLVQPGQLGAMLAFMVVAGAATHEVHPEVAEGPAGQLLVVYVNDKDWDDRRVEARLVQAAK